MRTSTGLVPIFLLTLTVSTWAGEPPTFVLEWGSEGSEPGQFRFPMDVSVDAEGYVYVADGGNARVQKFDNDGNFIQQWEVDSGPMEVLVHGSRVYVAAGREVERFDLEGNGDGKTQSYQCGSMGSLVGMGVTSEGELWVVNQDPFIHDIFVFDDQLNCLRGFGGYSIDISAFAINSQDEKCYAPFSCAEGSVTDLAFDREDNLYIAYRNEVRAKIAGELIIWGEQGEEPGQFNLALGIAADSQGNIFVADATNHRIQKFSFGSVPTESVTWGRIKAMYRP